MRFFTVRLFQVLNITDLCCAWHFLLHLRFLDMKKRLRRIKGISCLNCILVMIPSRAEGFSARLSSSYDLFLSARKKISSKIGEIGIFRHLDFFFNFPYIFKRLCTLVILFLFFSVVNTLSPKSDWFYRFRNQKKIDISVSARKLAPSRCILFSFLLNS